MADKVFAIPNVQTPSVPVRIDPTKCIGCNTCVEVCQIDVFIPNPEKGKPPHHPPSGGVLVLRLLRHRLPHPRRHGIQLAPAPEAPLAQ